MALKLPDSAVPMGDFPVAKAVDIDFNDGENLQDKFDNGELGGGGSSEKQIKDWVSGSNYLEGDYIYHEGEIYRCLTSNSDVDFDETNWEQVTYGIDELSKEDVEGLLGLTEEEIEDMADLILDTEVRIDKTYSSSKIYTDIQQCLEDSKTYTLEELGKYATITTVDGKADKSYVDDKVGQCVENKKPNAKTVSFKLNSATWNCGTIYGNTHNGGNFKYDYYVTSDDIKLVKQDVYGQQGGITASLSGTTLTLTASEGTTIKTVTIIKS